MFKDVSILGIIPARSGSKGLPNKNIMNCAGKPLIQWTIQSALEVKYFDDVIVTTDSHDIANIAKLNRANVPFIRPPSLSNDNSSMVDVVKHAIENHFNRNGKIFDYIVLLQPTSPLRSSQHIKNAIEFFFEKKTSDKDGLASAYQVSSKYGWLMESNDENNYIKFSIETNILNPQRQNLKKYFLPNGAIIIAKSTNLNFGFYSNNTICYPMTFEESIDIDTFDDFCVAEKALLKL